MESILWKSTVETGTTEFSVLNTPIIRRTSKEAPMARMVNCIKLGKEAEGLDFPPYPGELGKRIWESVSKEAWAAWLKHQTMLVNENRLNLADARARQYLARQMEKHFFGEGADAAQGYVPPTA
jgi:Fe-S cluster biosynthesis and repair protein YggX